MKKDIHPEYHDNCKVACVCGNNFVTGSTKKEIKVDLCSACHPFYTGKQKLVDTARRVEKFRAKVETQKEISKTRKGKTVKKAAQAKKRAVKASSKVEKKVIKKVIKTGKK